ncbi:C-GCAxxG-C-C family protein [bacterium]|nr:C-GCAxxG-C-C family protein [bacterium]
MLRKRAVDNYTGKNRERLNCAQSIIEAFKEKFDIKDDLIEEFNAYGGGKAPDGLCGAFFAALHLLEKRHPEMVNDFENFFLEYAGYKTCKDLKINKVSCIRSIEKSAEFLQDIDKKKGKKN